MLQIDKNANNAAVKMGLLMMKDVSGNETWDANKIVSGLRNKYSDVDRKALKMRDPIQHYVSYYKRFGYTYPVLNQLESILQGKRSVPEASGLLQAMFLSELDGMLLTAGHDSSRLRPPFCLKVADGQEHYQSISGKETTTVQGDVMLCDADHVRSSILRGPDYDSRITPSTKDVLFTVYAPAGIDTGYIQSNLRQLEKWIREFSPKASTGLLSVFE
jgi:hypothetical protein